MRLDDNRKVIGYTAGVYDMFHIGHLNILRRAKENCDYLIVGVNSDELTYKYKNKHPIIPLEERMEIIKSIRYVDRVVRADDVVRVDENSRVMVYDEFQPDCIVIGDDHAGDPRWQEVDKYLRMYNSRVIFLPYTGHTSSTKLREVIDRVS